MLNQTSADLRIPNESRLQRLGIRGHPDLYEDCRPKGARRSWDGNVIIKVEVACNEVWVGGRFERDNLLHIESSPMQRSNVNDKAVRVIVTCQRGNLLMKWPGQPPAITRLFCHEEATSATADPRNIPGALSERQS